MFPQTSWDQCLQAVWAKWKRSRCPKIYSWQGCCWLTRRGHERHSNHAITSKLFCLISALMGNSGQYLLCLLWPPWSIIKASLRLSTPCCPPTSACVWMVRETLRRGSLGPLAHWLQAHLQASEAKVIPRAPVRWGVHLRERDSAGGWRKEFLGFSSEGKTNALHSEENGIQWLSRSQTLIPEAHLEMQRGTRKKPVEWI